MVLIENGQRAVRLRAVITETAVRPSVLASPKGRWARLSGGRNVNWTTPQRALGRAGRPEHVPARPRICSWGRGFSPKRLQKFFM